LSSFWKPGWAPRTVKKKKSFLCPLFHLEVTVGRVIQNLTYFPGKFFWLGRKDGKNHEMISRQ
jgi:hypothetical protein